MSEEILKRLIEKITRDAEVIFHQVNRRIEVNKPLTSLIEEAIKTKEPDLQYISEKTEHGHMIAKVYIFDNVAIIEETWIPTFGFSWEEKRITLLKLKSPTEE
ncbi:MAG: hypothetical protein QXP96_04925 [Thermoproteota archaeon]